MVDERVAIVVDAIAANLILLVDIVGAAAQPGSSGKSMRPSPSSTTPFAHSTTPITYSLNPPSSSGGVAARCRADGRLECNVLTSTGDQLAISPDL
jgi:hypothetical protein